MKTSDNLKIGISCTKCCDRLFSISRHDFKWCKCKTVAIDGGDDYLKVTGTEWARIEMPYKEWSQSITPPSKMTKEEYTKALLLMFDACEDLEG